MLVANAGVGTQLPWDEVDLDTWDRAIDVNLRAPWLLTQAALPGMLERGFGRILYVSSVAALNGGVVGPHYAASKAGPARPHAPHRAARRRPGRHREHDRARARHRHAHAAPPARTTPPRCPCRCPSARLGTTDEVADLALAMLRNGYLTNKTYTLDGGLVPA